MFLNDDGNVLNVTGKQNIYQFNFTYQKGASINVDAIHLNITHMVKADLLPMMNATVNDFLGQIFIYNANSDLCNMEGKYQLNVTYNDGSWKVLDQQAQFNP